MKMVLSNWTVQQHLDGFVAPLTKVCFKGLIELIWYIDQFVRFKRVQTHDSAYNYHTVKFCTL